MHVRDGVVDHDPDRHHQPGQQHHVQRDVTDHQDRAGDGQRSDDRGDGGDDRAPRCEQEHEHGDEEETPDRQGHRHVTGGRLDVVRRSEEGGVDLHPTESLTERVERLLDAVRHLDGVRIGELLHDQHQPGLALGEDRVTDQWLVVLDQFGDVAEQHRLSIDDHGVALVVLDRDLCQVVGGLDRVLVPDPEALVRCVDEPRGSRCGRLEEGQG